MEEEYKIWFSRVEISNKIKQNILEYYSEKEIWNMQVKDFKEKFENIDDKIILKIKQEKYIKNLEKYKNYMKTKNIKLISFKDINYPQKLKNIYDKPTYIFIRGNENILNEDNTAIIGARDATEYGKKIARKFAKELSDKNINIVSGLAVGIDKYAHLGSLESNIGKTIAVLGTGIGDEDIYPLQNKRVYERIIENGGAIVSEYIIGTKPLKHHFPERNRIISGLSDKIVIIEAKERSGSLITVDYGLEQGKEIFAVPRKCFFIKFERCT